MQNENDARNDEKSAALEAIERICNEQSEEDFLEDSLIIGKALRKEFEAMEARTTAKMVHPQGLIASKAFEDFVKEHFTEAKHFDRIHDEFRGEVSYDVILPRVFIGHPFNTEDVKKFAEILGYANSLDIGIERENPEYKGMIYLDVSFPTLIRVEEES